SSGKLTFWHSDSMRVVNWTAIRAGNVRRPVGYIAAFMVASLFYVALFSVADWRAGSGGSFQFQVEMAIVFWLVEGVAAALAAMALPWSLAVIFTNRVGRLGVVSWLALGGALT